MIYSPNLLKPAEVAFNRARDIFESQGTRDPKKRRLLEGLSATTLEDLLATIADTKRHYDQDRSGSKLRRCMEHISERIHYYGNIMDVLVQHHPEYVSLAWGAMKLLFSVSFNAERYHWKSVAGTLCYRQ